MAVNRCSYCGEDVLDRKPERIGQTRIWLCDETECQLDFERDSREAEEEDYQNELDDLNVRYDRGS